MTDKSINELIHEYRNYIAAEELNIQQSVYWGDNRFEDVIDHLYDQLRPIKRHGLLKFVRTDFSNVEKLYDRVLKREAEIEEREISDALDEVHKVAETTQSTVAPKGTSITLSQLMESYLDKKQNSVRPKTGYHSKRHMGFLIETVGDIEVRAFDQSYYRKYLKALDARGKKKRGVTIPASAVTKNEYLKTCKRMFDHAINVYDRKLTNYFEGQTSYFEQSKQLKKERVPFNDDDLQRMFTHDIYTQGTFKHPYQYWIPLIALYSGSRANEIAQLRVNDIVVENGVHCIRHEANRSDKRIKTGDKRMVPIHPKLVELGFLNFVELFKEKNYQWTDEEENHRIFKGLSFSERDGYVRNLSRWFGGDYDAKRQKSTGFKDKAGVITDAGEEKVFHSFRHTFSTALQNAKVPDELSYQMTGHKDGKQLLGGVGRRYRKGARADVLYDELCKLDYGKPLKQVKPFFELNGEKKCRNKIKGKSVKKSTNGRQ